MIHFLTAHRGDEWVDIQLSYFRRHLREPYVVWASIEDVRAELAAAFDHAIPMQGEHAEKLNELWRLAGPEVAGDDIVVFLDSDTLTIADPLPLIREALEEHDLVAVKRLEDGGTPQPHPCFAAATAQTWRDLNCDWRKDYLGDAVVALRHDVGGRILREIERRSVPWLPLHRLNTVDLHPVMFGVYGGAIYHHGAGSRTYPLFRPEWAQMPWPQSRSPILRFVRKVPVALRRRWRMRQNKQLSRIVFEQLRTDPEFWHQFVPELAGG